jgi:hypothetical protein
MGRNIFLDRGCRGTTASRAETGDQGLGAGDQGPGTSDQLPADFAPSEATRHKPTPVGQRPADFLSAKPSILERPADFLIGQAHFLWAALYSGQISYRPSRLLSANLFVVQQTMCVRGFMILLGDKNRKHPNRRSQFQQSYQANNFRHPEAGITVRLLVTESAAPSK